MKYTRKIYFVMSDPHAGFSAGLYNPETRLDSPDTKIVFSQASETSQFIWDVFIHGIEETKKLAGKDEIVVICLGDITHGNTFITQNLTTCTADQPIIAYNNFLPLCYLKNVKVIRMATGTPVHDGSEGSSEKLVKIMLQNKFPKLDIQTVYHGLYDSIDYAHHGPPPGARNWSRGNSARSYLQSLMLDCLDNNFPVPNVVLRGHYHEYVKVWHSEKRDGKLYESWLMIAPSLCSMSEFGLKATKSQFIISPGVIAIEAIEGRMLQSYEFSSVFDSRYIEELL